MVLENLLEEIEILNEKGIPRFAKHLDEYYFLVLDNHVNGAEIETLSGENYSQKLNKKINYNCTIFLNEDVPEKFKPVVLFHEIIESIYMRFGSEQPKAHEYAKELEKEYAKLFLDEPDEFFEWIGQKRENEDGNLFDSY